ncbi:MAG: hypothetical protein AAF532_06240 [Planctomycetota bacterium]
MPRPRLLVDHLVRDLEDRRRSAPAVARPDWIDRLVGEVAEHFEPIEDIARVGFECAPVEGLWAVTFFLGVTERVGGPDDGRRVPADFHFDLAGFTRLFDEVESLRFEAFPGVTADEHRPYHAGVTLVGSAEGHACRVRVLAVPPEDVEPGLTDTEAGGGSVG